MQKSDPWHIIFENETEVHGEKIAIAILINKLKKDPNYPEHIGLISDHELEKHPQYNKQELPLFNSFYLPKGYEIAYASADRSKKNDTILNRVMTECDDSSTKLLNSFIEYKKINIADKEIKLEGIPKISLKNLSKNV